MNSRVIHHAPLLLLLCGAGITGLLAPWARVPSMLSPAPRYLADLAGAFALYALAGALVSRAPQECSSRAGMGILLGVALLVRLLLLPALPSLSTDIFRYLWDGKVSVHGANPYALPPSAPELAPLRGPTWARIDYLDERTAYPPAAQAVFALAARIHADDPLPLKSILVGADLAAILALIALLRRAGRPPALALLYAWNPLVISETALSGHMDVLAVAPFLLALLALQRGDARGLWAGVLLLGVSLAAKPFAVVALPILARWRGVRVPALAVGVAVAAFLPYLDAGGHIMGGAQAMAGRFRNNGSLHEVCARLLEGHVGRPDALARRLLAALVIAATLWLARRPVTGTADLWRRLSQAFTVALLASPVVHPWYLLWLAPFHCLAPAATAVAFTARVILKHKPRRRPPTLDPRHSQHYAPVYVLLLWEAWTALRGRRGGGATCRRACE